MQRDDQIRLRHMLDAAREAMQSAQDRSRSDLDSDRIWALGVVKCVEIIGEAAAQVSAETRSQRPQIPWRAIIAMRNRLVHAYFDIDLDQVWQTLTDDLPGLAAELEEMLATQ